MQTFVVPALDGPITGGTRYNRELLRALAELGVPARAVDLDEARRLLEARDSGRMWIDSLYLHEVPALRRLAGRGVTLGLVLHFLPSLVERAFGRESSDLERMEASAFACADSMLVPSAFLRQEVLRRGVLDELVVAIEPGIPIRPAAEAPPVGRVAAQIAASLVRNKGIIELLQALAHIVSGSDDFALHLAGGESAEPAYARECRALVETHATLRARVHFDGPLEHVDVERRLALSNLFVSASFGESYGMALAEARAAGVPILALDGGNVRAHVSSASGGELLATHAELAHAFVSLCRDRRELERRVNLARAHALATAARSWGDAAKEFRDALASLA